MKNLAKQLIQSIAAGQPPNIALMHLLMAAGGPGERPGPQDLRSMCCVTVSGCLLAIRLEPLAT